MDNGNQLSDGDGDCGDADGLMIGDIATSRDSGIADGCGDNNGTLKEKERDRMPKKRVKSATSKSFFIPKSASDTFCSSSSSASGTYSPAHSYISSACLEAASGRVMDSLISKTKKTESHHGGSTDSENSSDESRDGDGNGSRGMSVRSDRSSSDDDRSVSDCTSNCNSFLSQYTNSFRSSGSSRGSSSSGYGHFHFVTEDAPYRESQTSSINKRKVEGESYQAFNIFPPLSNKIKTTVDKMCPEYDNSAILTTIDDPNFFSLGKIRPAFP
jgi:hypothetical protein